VHALRLVPEHNTVARGVDLGVEVGISDEVHDPPLRISLGHVELLRDHADVDALVDAAVRLEDVQARVFDELLVEGREEEVVGEDGLAFAEPLLGGLEVELDEEGVEELGDWVGVRVGFLLDDLEEVLEEHALLLVGDDSDGEVAEDVRARRLDGVQVLVIEEELQDQIATAGVVEKDEEAPVNKPSPLLQEDQGGGCSLCCR